MPKDRGKRTEYVRVTAMFESDYPPEGAKYALRGKVSGEYLVALKEVIDEAEDDSSKAVLFSLVKWRPRGRGESEEPVLSVAVVDAKSARRDRDRDDDRDDDRRDRDDDRDDDRRDRRDRRDRDDRPSRQDHDAERKPARRRERNDDDRAPGRDLD